MNVYTVGGQGSPLMTEARAEPSFAAKGSFGAADGRWGGERRVTVAV